MLYFFLSYARGGDDPYVQEFFNDLCNEVRALEGLRPDDDVGFLDNRNIQPGDTWPETLVDALSQCRTFLALCSPAYFLSKPCGREWAIFQERARQHQLRTGITGSALLPVRWLPPRTMPQAAQVIQYVLEPHRENPRREPHRERGVRQLLRISRNRDDYLEFVTMLAEKIVDAMENAPAATTAGQLQFEEVPSAFHTEQLGATARPQDSDGRLNSVPGQIVELAAEIPLSSTVHFVVSAPTIEESADVALGRHDRRFYGPHARDWSPYDPAPVGPIAAFATHIAAGQSLNARVIEVHELEECIDRARRDNQIVVLLVDPWSTKMASHREILGRYDARTDQPATVLIPWSTSDIETSSKTPELNMAVRRAFPRNTRRTETTFRQSVLTNESFRSDLLAVLDQSCSRVITNGVLRRSSPGSVGSRPILEGP